MNNYYIYIYLDPRKNGQYCYDDVCFLFEPIYVGKGKNGRWKNISGRNEDFTEIVSEIKKLELEPVIIKLYENLNEEESFKLETKLINEIGRLDLGTGTLINKTSGGQGSSGYKFLKEIVEFVHKRQRKNFLDIEYEFERRNYKLLSEEKDYKNAFTKLNYICPRGHEGYIRWANFQQGQNCPYCKEIKINFCDIKKEFERRDYILLIEEKEYKNNYTKLNYICPRGHEGSMRWSHFQQEHDCPICYNESRSEKMKGKNSILIIQDVVQIKLLLKEGNLTQKEIADIFCIAKSTVSKIKFGKLWRHIKI